jgi:hypothetical protein
VVNEVKLQEKEIEKKERLAQTYIVLFGLLLASNQNENVQQYLVLIFYFFLVTIIPYYTFLSSIKNPIKKNTDNSLDSINLFATLAAFLFGCAVVIYTYSVVIYTLTSIIIPLLNFIANIFTSDFVNCSINVNTYSTSKSSRLLLASLFILLPQCFLLTIFTAYSLTIIPSELKNNDPLKEIVTMIKMLKS